MNRYNDFGHTNLSVPKLNPNPFVPNAPSFSTS